MTSKLEAVSIQTRALDALRQEFGDIVKTHGGKIGEGEAILSFSFQTATPEQMAMILRGRFVQYSRELGLVPSDFDLPLTVQGQKATLIRVTPSQPKFPFTVMMEDGRQLKIGRQSFLIARGLAAIGKQTVILAALRSNGKASMRRNGHATTPEAMLPPVHKFKPKGRRARELTT